MSSPQLVPRSRYYGPEATCTLNAPGCPTEASVYGYQPSIGANAAFLAIFAIVLIVQLIQGIRWRAWSYAFAMFWGCVCEILGYSGRIMLWQNPFSFVGFLMQIILITLGPAFFSAAIYLTITKIILFLGPQYSRFKPQIFYWLFIPCDVISLVLQGSGGGLSSSSEGQNTAGVDVAIAGLVFQVFTLTVFVALTTDYVVRYLRGVRRTGEGGRMNTSFKVFALFQSAAIIFIFIRCVYRIYELHNGYTGPTIRDEGMFVALESVMVIIAALCLTVGHPGFVFGKDAAAKDAEVGEKEANLRSASDSE